MPLLVCQASMYIGERNGGRDGVGVRQRWTHIYVLKSGWVGVGRCEWV